jgi:hypothetical protein
VHHWRAAPRPGNNETHLDKLNADLIAAPPLDAGLAPGGVERQQQGKRLGDFTFDRQPCSGWGKVDEAARPDGKAVIESNPRPRAWRAAGRSAPFGALSCEHGQHPRREQRDAPSNVAESY